MDNHNDGPEDQRWPPLDRNCDERVNKIVITYMYYMYMLGISLLNLQLQRRGRVVGAQGDAANSYLFKEDSETPTASDISGRNYRI